MPKVEEKFLAVKIFQQEKDAVGLPYFILNRFGLLLIGRFEKITVSILQKIVM